jgi:hypothetical protein
MWPQGLFAYVRLRYTNSTHPNPCICQQAGDCSIVHRILHHFRAAAYHGRYECRPMLAMSYAAVCLDQATPSGKALSVWRQHGDEMPAR